MEQAALEYSGGEENAEELQGNSVHFKHIANVIPVFVHQEDINLLLLVDASQILGGLKSIVWLARGETVDIVNGCHRMESLKKYMTVEEKQLDGAQKEVRRLKGNVYSLCLTKQQSSATRSRSSVIYWGNGWHSL